MNIIIFGPQGSGKGTQAEILAEKLKVPRVSTGDIFREHIKNKTELGQKAQEYLEKGQLFPDDLTIQLVKDRLSQPDCQPGFILDGFPRTMPQAEALDTIAAIDKVLEVWISDEEAVKRIGGRRTCLKCGAVYHLEFNPPKEENFCDNCQNRLVVRKDDTEEVIKKRLENYHQQTEPIKDFYQNQGKLIKIDGMPSIPEVTNQIFNQLNL